MKRPSAVRAQGKQRKRCSCCSSFSYRIESCEVPGADQIRRLMAQLKKNRGQTEQTCFAPREKEANICAEESDRFCAEESDTCTESYQAVPRKACAPKSKPIRKKITDSTFNACRLNLWRRCCCMVFCRIDGKIKWTCSHVCFLLPVLRSFVCFPQATCDREQEASCGIQTFRSHQGAQHYRNSRWQCRLAKSGPWKRISRRICFPPMETVHKNCFWNHQTTSVERLDAPRFSSVRKEKWTHLPVLDACPSGVSVGLAAIHWKAVHLLNSWNTCMNLCTTCAPKKSFQSGVRHPWGNGWTWVDEALIPLIWSSFFGLHKQCLKEIFTICIVSGRHDLKTMRPYMAREPSL